MSKDDADAGLAEPGVVGLGPPASGGGEVVHGMVQLTPIKPKKRTSSTSTSAAKLKSSAISLNSASAAKDRSEPAGKMDAEETSEAQNQDEAEEELLGVLVEAVVSPSDRRGGAAMAIMAAPRSPARTAITPPRSEQSKQRGGQPRGGTNSNSFGGTKGPAGRSGFGGGYSGHGGSYGNGKHRMFGPNNSGSYGPSHGSFGRGFGGRGFGGSSSMTYQFEIGPHTAGPNSGIIGPPPASANASIGQGPAAVGYHDHHRFVGGGGTGSGGPPVGPSAPLPAGMFRTVPPGVGLGGHYYGSGGGGPPPNPHGRGRRGPAVPVEGPMIGPNTGGNNGGLRSLVHGRMGLIQGAGSSRSGYRSPPPKTPPNKKASATCTSSSSSSKSASFSSSKNSSLPNPFGSPIKLESIEAEAEFLQKSAEAATLSSSGSEGDDDEAAAPTVLKPVTWEGYGTTVLTSTTNTKTSAPEVEEDDEDDIAAAIDDPSAVDVDVDVPPPPHPSSQQQPTFYTMGGYTYHGCPPPKHRGQDHGQGQDRKGPHKVSPSGSPPSSSTSSSVPFATSLAMAAAAASSASTSKSTLPPSFASSFGSMGPIQMAAKGAHLAAIAALNGDGDPSSGSTGTLAAAASGTASAAVWGGGGLVLDKVEAAAVAASKRKGRGQRKSSGGASSKTTGLDSDAASDDDDEYLHDDDDDYDGNDSDDSWTTGAKGKKKKQKTKKARKPRASRSREENDRLRNEMHAKIKQVMDLEQQEAFLNSQGRRTLRDSDDTVNICPSNTIYRAVMELFEVPTESGGEVLQKGEVFERGPFANKFAGQVGVRCVFCAPYVGDNEKGPRKFHRYPTHTDGIEQCVRNTLRNHVLNCPHIPAVVFDLVKEVKDKDIRGGSRGGNNGGSTYARLNAKLNLVNVGYGSNGGMMFGKGGMVFDDGTTLAERGFGNGPGLVPVPPPAVVPVANGAEVAEGGSRTVDVDVPIEKRGRKKRSDPGKKGPMPKKKKAKVGKEKEDEPMKKPAGDFAIAAPSAIEMADESAPFAPFVAASTDSKITVGGIPPSFFVGDKILPGIDALVPAAASPPQQEPAVLVAPSPPVVSEQPEPSPLPQARPPMVRMSRSGRVSKRRNWDDFATTEAEMKSTEAEMKSPSSGTDRHPPANPEAEPSSDPIVVGWNPALGGKTLAALSSFKTPRKSRDDEKAGPEALQSEASAATVTPIPQAKAKAKPKAKKPRARKATQKNRKKRMETVVGGTKVHGKWSEEEEAKFFTALEIFGKDWVALSEYIGTRSPLQCKSKNQKIEMKSQKSTEVDGVAGGDSEYPSESSSGRVGTRRSAKK